MMEAPRATTKRVLAAALEVFSEQGLGATTREIARVAGVNEVTLFRQFASKENLIREVTREMCRLQSEALDQVDFVDFDLPRDLLRIAEAYDRSSTENMGFIRTLMAQPAHMRLSDRIVDDIVEPLRAKFLTYLEEARRRGLVREMDLVPAVDAFTGMIFAGALRRYKHRQRYAKQLYLQTCMELFLRGIVAS